MSPVLEKQIKSPLNRDGTGGRLYSELTWIAEWDSLHHCPSQQQEGQKKSRDPSHLSAWKLFNEILIRAAAQRLSASSANILRPPAAGSTMTSLQPTGDSGHVEACGKTADGANWGHFCFSSCLKIICVLLNNNLTHIHCTHPKPNNWTLNKGWFVCENQSKLVYNVFDKVE